MSSTQQTPCPCEDWLASYLFGELEGAEEQAFLTHAKSCEMCAAGMAEQASWDAAFVPSPERIDAVSATEHQRLLETVFERQPSPLPKRDVKSDPVAPSTWWDGITAGFAQWLGPWQMAGVAAAALLLFWVYGLTPKASELVSVAANTSSPMTTYSGTHWTRKTQRVRTQTRIQPPALARSRPAIHEMTVSIEFQEFAPLNVKKSVQESYHSFDFVATVIQGANKTKPKRRSQAIESSFAYTVEPSPSLFYALTPIKPTKKDVSPVAQDSSSEDVLEQSEAILSIGQGGALVPGGTLATLAALEHRPYLLDHTQQLPHPTRMQVWKQQSIRTIH